MQESTIKSKATFILADQIFLLKPKEISILKSLRSSEKPLTLPQMFFFLDIHNRYTTSFVKHIETEMGKFKRYLEA